jgi:ethanolamine utilization microcompartment shell protein EutS
MDVVEYVQLNQRILNFLICNPESSICKILGIQAYKIGI